MDEFERHLSERLHEAYLHMRPRTDLLAAVARRRRRRRAAWVGSSVVAVVCAALLIPISLIGTGPAGHRPGPTATSPMASTPPNPTGTPSAPPTKTPWSGAWGATAITRLGEVGVGPLIGNGHSLYATARPSPTSPLHLVRIDPATGKIAASAPDPIAAGEPTPTPTVAAGYLWLARYGSLGHVDLYRFNPTTLRAASTVDIPIPGVTPSLGCGPILTSTPPSDGFLLGAGTTLALVDPHTGHVIKNVQIAEGNITALAYAANGTACTSGRPAAARAPEKRS